MRYTVLTYIFCGYENVLEIEEKDPNAEYILITDDKNLKSDTWCVIYDPKLEGLSPFDKCYEVRWHPFRYAMTDIVLRIDGSIKVKKSLAPIIDEFERGNYDRCFLIHPKRNRIDVEYDVWTQTRGYSREQANKCIDMMRRLGYDFNNKGLVQGNFEIIRKTADNLNMNDLIFDFHKYLGTDGKIERVDQTITSFVLQTLFQDRLKIMAVSEGIVTQSEFMQWYLHKTNRKLCDQARIQPYLFNKPIQVWR